MKKKIMDKIAITFLIFGIGLNLIETFINKWYFKIISIALLYFICRCLIDYTGVK